MKKNKSNPELLAILACPACRGRLKLSKSMLKCIKCKKSYAIKNGVPYMLIKK